MDFDVIILAGGRSRRMGTDKAELMLGRVPMLRRVWETAWTWDPGRVLVVGPPRPWLEEADYVADLVLGPSSSLRGLYSGIKAASAPWQLVLGCDMPFVSRDFVRLLWEHKNSHGAVAWWHNRLQPLPGLYSRQATTIAEQLLAEGRYHLAALLDKLAPAEINRQAVTAVDKEGHSFFNINSPQDMTQAEDMLAWAQVHCPSFRE